MDLVTKEGVKGANEVAEQLRQLEIADGVQEYEDKMEVEGASPSLASELASDPGA